MKTKKLMMLPGLYQQLNRCCRTLFCCLVLAPAVKAVAYPAAPRIAPLVTVNASDSGPLHPRGLINLAGQKALMLKLPDALYRNQLQALEERLQAQQGLAGAVFSAKNAYQAGEMLESLAYAYALTQNKRYADSVTVLLERVIRDPTVFLQPMVKGLTRAQLVKAAAIAYDLCYDALPAKRRSAYSTQLFAAALSMQSIMGVEANYAQESNWMGVRYGTVLFTALVCDEPPSPGFKNSLADALVWDARERLRDHIQQNINPGGWTAESMGYHFYNWSFIAPALIALENSTPLKEGVIPQLAPNALRSARAAATACINMAGAKGKGIKADLADDNLGVDANFFWYALRLYPAEQKPYLKWTAHYLESIENIKSFFLKAAFDDPTITTQNPGKAGWLNFADTMQGVTVCRNRFEDSNDIVSTFTATAKRVRAHQSGDNLSFRILGLNNIWAIGGGRTGLKAGQTNLFPEENIPLDKSYERGKQGRLLHCTFAADGSGTSTGWGSCMGVVNHQRIFTADYDPSTGAQAVFIVVDSSDNGRTWRLNTPPFNKVRIAPDGFLLIAPDSSSLKALVIGAGYKPVTIRTTDIPYDGVTKENTTGIYFKGSSYTFTKAVDIGCDKNITVVMTLTKKNQTHPIVQQMDHSKIVVGKKEYFIHH